MGLVLQRSWLGRRALRRGGMLPVGRGSRRLVLQDDEVQRPLPGGPLFSVLRDLRRVLRGGRPLIRSRRRRRSGGHNVPTCVVGGREGLRAPGLLGPLAQPLPPDPPGASSLEHQVDPEAGATVSVVFIVVAYDPHLHDALVVGALDLVALVSEVGGLRVGVHQGQPAAVLHDLEGLRASIVNHQVTGEDGPVLVWLHLDRLR
mmetsp:Transcript_54754/g.163001  ORF Transcript_54754/g.163001 Transcript_54754/m.163001 type:complete len:203 (+) Transcript_54754:315-923(+)